MKSILAFVLILLCPLVSSAGDITRYAKPIQTTHGIFYHVFDVITFDDGWRKLAVRGGPTDTTGGFATAPENSLVSSAEALTGHGNTFGSVVASVRTFDPDHPDYDIKHASGYVVSSYNQWPSLVLVTDYDHNLAQYVAKYETAVATVNNMAAKYNPANNNSNTTIFVAASAAGTCCALPDAALVEIRAPGWGHAMYKEASVINGLQGTSYDGTRIIPAPPITIAPLPSEAPPQPISVPPPPPPLGFDVPTFSVFEPGAGLNIPFEFSVEPPEGQVIVGPLIPIDPLPGMEAPLEIPPPFQPTPREIHEALARSMGFSESVIESPDFLDNQIPFGNNIPSFGSYTARDFGIGFGMLGQLYVQGYPGFDYRTLPGLSGAAPPNFVNPEPSTWLLMGTGVALLLWREVRRRRVSVSV